MTDINFRWRLWGSSLPGLRMLDPPLSPQSTPAEICQHPCIHMYGGGGGGRGGWGCGKKNVELSRHFRPFKALFLFSKTKIGPEGAGGRGCTLWNRLVHLHNPEAEGCLLVEDEFGTADLMSRRACSKLIHAARHVLLLASLVWLGQV